MPEISVLLPVYNVEDYIGETIESILQQSYSGFELIVVDDGSTDQTFNVVKKYSHIDDRIRLYKNNQNAGISKTLNRALSVATGEFIARVDGDDTMECTRLERQLNFLNNNSEYGLVGCWVENIDESGEVINRCKYPVTHEQSMECILICSPVLHVWMAKAAVYEKLSGYRNTNPAEDYDFLLRCIDKGYKVGNLPYFGAGIRLREGNTMTIAALKQRKAFNFLRSLFVKGVINDQEKLDLSECEKISSNKCISYMHEFSVRCLKKALGSNNCLVKILFAIGTLASPYTVQDVCRRIKFKRIVSSYGLKEQK